jgi:hypothetical protein
MQEFGEFHTDMKELVALSQSLSLCSPCDAEVIE